MKIKEKLIKISKPYQNKSNQRKLLNPTKIDKPNENE